jgi:hypothetical protein
VFPCETKCLLHNNNCETTEHDVWIIMMVESYRCCVDVWTWVCFTHHASVAVHTLTSQQHDHAPLQSSSTEAICNTTRTSIRSDVEFRPQPEESTRVKTSQGSYRTMVWLFHVNGRSVRCCYNPLSTKDKQSILVKSSI